MLLANQTCSLLLSISALFFANMSLVSSCTLSDSMLLELSLLDDDWLPEDIDKLEISPKLGMFFILYWLIQSILISPFLCTFFRFLAPFKASSWACKAFVMLLNIKLQIPGSEFFLGGASVMSVSFLAFILSTFLFLRASVIQSANDKP